MKTVSKKFFVKSLLTSENGDDVLLETNDKQEALQLVEDLDDQAVALENPFGLTTTDRTGFLPVKK